MTRGPRSLPVGRPVAGDTQIGEVPFATRFAFLCIVFGPIFALGQSPSKSEVVRESDDFVPTQEKLPVVAPVNT